jgi:hypothetical protein
LNNSRQTGRSLPLSTRAPVSPRQRVDGLASYVEFLTCLQMAREPTTSTKIRAIRKGQIRWDQSAPE